MSLPDGVEGLNSEIVLEGNFVDWRDGTSQSLFTARITFLKKDRKVTSMLAQGLKMRAQGLDYCGCT